LIPWEKDFTLVEWDQRGAGRTFGRNGPDGTGVLSIDRLTQDGIELTQHLRSRLQKDQVILFGVSFGSVIGLRMVYGRPDLFATYVGSGQFVNARDGDALGYKLTLTQAQAIGKEGSYPVAALRSDGSSFHFSKRGRSNAEPVTTSRSRDSGEQR
jgi:pimeloyl-ACP methyl ester carboxylesterase